MTLLAGILLVVRRTAGSIALAGVVAIAIGTGEAAAVGLLRIENCRIVDDSGPVKAMGVNYVDGFWKFAADGDRYAYLPYLDALAEAKIPFIRMVFGPWAPNNVEGPAAPAIAYFVTHQELYFERLNSFLEDAKDRHIGVVLGVFGGIDPYLAYFREPATAWSDPKSRTSDFLRGVLTELAQRHGNDPTIWMIEFLNEGNLLIDFPRAPHTRAELVALIDYLAAALHNAGDRHIVETGNGLPRPAAEHLDKHQGWRPDTRDDFLRAFDAETPAGAAVASVHVYPERKAARPWDGDDVLDVLPLLIEHGRKTCRPLFVGEFGAIEAPLEQIFIDQVGQSDVSIAAVWGFGRFDRDPFAFGIDTRGKAILRRLATARRL